MVANHVKQTRLSGIMRKIILGSFGSIVQQHHTQMDGIQWDILLNAAWIYYFPLCLEIHMFNQNCEECNF